MAKDVGDAIGAAIGHAAREVVDTVSANARKGSKKAQLPQLSGGRGMAAGAGLVALVPLAAKGAGMVRQGLRNGSGPLQAAEDKVGGTVKDAVGKTVDEAGGASGLVKEAGKSMLPFGGGEKSGGGGVGQGRLMPIQQAVDVSVPIADAYAQWTQYEEWPKFMHRLDRVSQEDDTHISFKTKIWAFSREFEAEIIDEQPEERIKWRVTDGVSHTGVVTFHELGPRLTRIDVDIDVQPGSLIEKLGRGLRHAKRAVRADLHRFKAHVEIEEEAESEGGEEQEQQEQEQQEPQARQRSSRSGGASTRRRSASASRSRSGAGRSGSGSDGAAASSGSSARGRSRSSSSANGSGSSRSAGARSSSGGSSRRSRSSSS